jgi:hypothetical protein
VVKTSRGAFQNRGCAARRGAQAWLVGDAGPRCGWFGSVAEWFKALVLKTSVRGTVPWVRIPPLPPTLKILQSLTNPSPGISLLDLALGFQRQLLHGALRLFEAAGLVTGALPADAVQQAAILNSLRKFRLHRDRHGLTQLKQSIEPLPRKAGAAERGAIPAILDIRFRLSAGRLR